MSLTQSWRSSRIATAVGASAVAATVLMAALPTPAYATALTGTITITSGSRLGSGTAKQVVVLTVSGATLSEDTVASVSLGLDTNCAALSSYVVTSPTSMTVKTPTLGCALTDQVANPLGEPIVITFADASTLTKTNGLFFIGPPSLATTKPVITENSSGLGSTYQVQRLAPGGGQTIRVKAGAAFIFDGRVAAALTASLGGKALTAIKVYNHLDVLLTTAAPDATLDVGNYFTAVTPTTLTTADTTLSVTQNTVVRSFDSTATGLSVTLRPNITSLSVTSGKANTATAVVITGTNFAPVGTLAAAALVMYTSGGTRSVNFCGVDVPIANITAATTTTVTLTTPNTLSANASGLGATTSSGPCPVRVVDATDPTTPVPSALNAASNFTFIVE